MDGEGRYTFIISAGPEHTIDRRTGSVMCAVRGRCFYTMCVYVYFNVLYPNIVSLHVHIV